MPKKKPKEPEIVIKNRQAQQASLKAKQAYENTLIFPNDPSVLRYYTICAARADQAAIELEKVKFKPRGVTV